MTSMDMDVHASLQASISGLAGAVTDLSRRQAHDARFLARANEAFRQVPFIINVPLVAGAATLNPAAAGPDTGYYWSIRKLAAVGFTVGTVNLYIDNTNGEPVVPFTSAGVFTFGKGEQIIQPGSNIAIVAATITGTVQIWGRADQFETWLLPWYLGAQGGAS